MDFGLLVNPAGSSRPTSRQSPRFRPDSARTRPMSARSSRANAQSGSEFVPEVWQPQKLTLSARGDWKDSARVQPVSAREPLRMRRRQGAMGSGVLDFDMDSLRRAGSLRTAPFSAQLIIAVRPTTTDGSAEPPRLANLSTFGGLFGPPTTPAPPQRPMRHQRVPHRYPRPTPEEPVDMTNERPPPAVSIAAAEAAPPVGPPPVKAPAVGEAKEEEEAFPPALNAEEEEDSASEDGDEADEEQEKEDDEEDDNEPDEPEDAAGDEGAEDEAPSTSKKPLGAQKKKPAASKSELARRIGTGRASSADRRASKAALARPASSPRAPPSHRRRYTGAEKNPFFKKRMQGEITARGSAQSSEETATKVEAIMMPATL